MAGYLHIFRVGTESQPHQKSVPEYQLTYNIGGCTFARSFDENALREFLAEEMAVDPRTVRNAMDELRSVGKTTISEVELPKNQAAALGLEQLPAD